MGFEYEEAYKEGENSPATAGTFRKNFCKESAKNFKSQKFHEADSDTGYSPICFFGI